MNWFAIALAVMGFFNIVCLMLCIVVCDKYITERNIYRDKWVRATEEYKDHLEWQNDDLRGQLAEYKEKEKEKENA